MRLCAGARLWCQFEDAEELINKTRGFLGETGATMMGPAVRGQQVRVGDTELRKCLQFVLEHSGRRHHDGPRQQASSMRLAPAHPRTHGTVC